MPTAPWLLGVQRGLVVAFVLLAATSAHAQTSNQRLPRFVVDVHGATVGLPQAEGWVPPGTTPTTTTTGTTTTTVSTVTLPGRNWGMAGGVNVYPFRLGGVTVGVGASILRGSKTEDTIVVTGTGETAVERVTASVHTGIISLVPQISINFGRKLGWSYMSAGIGRSKVSSRTEPSRITPVVSTTPVTTPTTPVVPVVVPEAWSQALNFGGGARWFMKPHLGAGFDVRFIKLGSRSPTDILPSAKRTQMWSISVGISIQ